MVLGIRTSKSMAQATGKRTLLFLHLKCRRAREHLHETEKEKDRLALAKTKMHSSMQGLMSEDFSHLSSNPPYTPAKTFWELL